MTWLLVAGATAGALLSITAVAVGLVKVVVAINNALESIEHAVTAIGQVTDTLKTMNRRLRRVEHHVGLRTDRRVGVDRRARSVL